MSSYEVCQHCSNSVRTSRAVFSGYSYHRRCRKCYVCSETDLQGAEVFRGVIFCASCAKRIFKGCATARARAAKQPRRVRRRRRAREQSVIARARAAPSASSLSSSHSKTEAAVPARDPRVSHDCYCVSDVVTQARKLINFIYFQTQNLVKNDKADIAQCTEVCQRMLADLCPMPDARAQPSPESSQPKLASSSQLRMSTADCCTSHSHPYCKGKEKKSKKTKKEPEPCSDLRIAELGASTEIATMALRKTSTKKVKSESKVTHRKGAPTTISMFSNMDSAASHTSNEEYLDSECQEYRGSNESEGRIFDHTFRSIMKIPCKFFKKNILERSSLISVIAGIDSERNFKAAYKRFKMLFHDDVLNHQHNGYKKLYSTINKKKTPYKLGWLEQDAPGDRKNCPCRHYAKCHSYRCMRQQVMRLAGPTQSKMCVYRSKVKKCVVPPFLKNLSFEYRSPIAKPAVCNLKDALNSKVPSSRDPSLRDQQPTYS